MLENYSGATRIIPIIGDPIAQVKSPAIVTRALEAAGHDAIVVPVHVVPADVPGLLAALDRVRNVDGIIATVPHKFAAFRHAASATERAGLLRAANLLRRTLDGGWEADMLDGLAMVRAIEQAGTGIGGRRALLVGAGGAGSAIGLELLNAGLAHLAVHDTDAARRDALLGLLNAAHPGRASAGSPDPADAELVVNATPAGMAAGDALPVRVERLVSHMLVGDVVTVPEITPLLHAAREAGCRIVTGVGMHKAGVQLIVDFLMRTR